MSNGITTQTVVFDESSLQPGLPVTVTLGAAYRANHRSQASGIVLQTSLDVLEVLVHQGSDFDKSGVLTEDKQGYEVGSSNDIAVCYINIKDVVAGRVSVDLLSVPTIQNVVSQWELDNPKEKPKSLMEEIEEDLRVDSKDEDTPF